jgi:hypothetical protein
VTVTGHTLSFTIEGHGGAAAVAPDGYFLTAAHCVKEPVFLEIIAGERTLAIERARVVWCGGTPISDDPWVSVGSAGEEVERAADFALLHVNVSATACFEWAAPEEVARDTDLALVATGGKPRREGLDIRAVAGRALGPLDASRPAAGGGPPIALLEFEGPGTLGDSGSAVLTRAGRLVGIEVRSVSRVPFGGAPFGTGKQVALRPDPAWLAAKIEEDRRARAAARASRAPP